MFYSFIKILFGAAVRIFFRKIVIIGEEKIPDDKPIILVANHPSAFMDPLVLGVMLKRPLYFFARADIFKPGFINWITKKAHVSPIYRIIDGAGSLEKNDAVFENAFQLLAENKMLLLFGEGFTDEIFIRRVKPMKKGSMRIALGAEKNFDFKLDSQIVCVGINYTDPGKFRSDVLISISSPIGVKKYKELYLEHNNKAMQELNKEIYSSLKNEVVHIENVENTELFEQLMKISGKGMENDFYSRFSLKERFHFSKRLSDAFNNKAEQDRLATDEIRSKCKTYFNELDRLKLSPKDFNENNSLVKKIVLLILGFPFFVFGILNNYLPAKISSVLSKKLSQRPVFWSSTDMSFSIITIPLYYLILLLTVNHFAGHFVPASVKYYFILLYILLMPLTGILSINYMKIFSRTNEIIRFNKIKKNKTIYGKLYALRKELTNDIEQLLA